MPICKKLVEAHEGRIWFESERGVGTTFFVELPLQSTLKPERAN
jgi:signal transduction histidine kinase